MPDDLYTRLYGATSGGMIEWFAVFSFIAYAIIYFLAPVLGYQSQTRSLLLFSLYLLIGYGLLILLQLLIQYLMVLFSSEGPTSVRATMHVITVFGIFKLVVFLAAQASFVFGLQKLRRGSAAGQ